jgi:hypothetical protein
LIIAVLCVQSWKAIPATARPFVVRLPLRRRWMLASLVFASGGAFVLSLEAVLGATFRRGGGAVGAFGAALIAAVCAVVGGSRAHALANRWRRR